MLELKQTQKLLPVLTQQLQQAIKLLQLSQLELREAIEEELEQNPVLESQDREGEEQPVKEADRASEDLAEMLDRFSPSDNFVGREEKEYPDYENFVKKTENLRDYLRWQAGLADFDAKERVISEWIIENIDDNGYLAFPLPEIAVTSGFPEEDLAGVLEKVQKLDPPGVGARDLKECVLIQYMAQKERDPAFEDIVRSHFDLLQKSNLKEVARRTGYPIEKVKEVIEKVKTFDPKPGRNYSDEFVSYVVPDVYVIKTEEGFEVLLNEEDLPELMLSNYYVDLCTDKDLSGEAKRYLKSKIKQAEWFMKSVQQRQKTLFLVARSIVAFQQQFMERGVKALRPLILRDVAQDVGVHESTVSRITSNKYMGTPHGVFEMKFFFPTGLSSDEGDALSTNVVMDFIVELIREEDKRNPLTDDQIVALLKQQQNIKIARRTIAKYRELLNISSSRERRLVD
jgi:RNA polymerase sigma-54 factor